VAITSIFEILIYPGLHSRPGKEFVNICMEYESSVKIKMNDNEFDGKSMIGILSLGIAKDKPFTLMLDGKEEEDFMSKFEDLIENE